MGERYGEQGQGRGRSIWRLILVYSHIYQSNEAIGQKRTGWLIRRRGACGTTENFLCWLSNSLRGRHRPPAKGFKLSGRGRSMHECPASTRRPTSNGGLRNMPRRSVLQRSARYRKTVPGETATESKTCFCNLTRLCR